MKILFLGLVLLASAPSFASAAGSSQGCQVVCHDTFWDVPGRKIHIDYKCEVVIKGDKPSTIYDVSLDGDWKSRPKKVGELCDDVRSEALSAMVELYENGTCQSINNKVLENYTGDSQSVPNLFENGYEHEPCI